MMNLKGRYLLINKDISDSDLKIIQAKDTVYKCTQFEIDELYLERHDRTNYYVTIGFENNEKTIDLTFDSDAERSKMINELFTIVK